jgi:hypothetical protein
VHGSLTFEDDSLCSFTCLGVRDAGGGGSGSCGISAVTATSTAFQLVALNEERSLPSLRSLPDVTSSQVSVHHPSPVITRPRSTRRVTASVTATKSVPGIVWPVSSMCGVDGIVYGQDSHGVFALNWESSQVMRLCGGEAGEFDGKREDVHGSLLSAAAWACFRDDAVSVLSSLLDVSVVEGVPPGHLVFACKGREIVVFAVDTIVSANPPSISRAVLATIDFDCTGLVVDARFGCLFLSNSADSAVTFIDLTKPKPRNAFKVRHCAARLVILPSLFCCAF